MTSQAEQLTELLATDWQSALDRDEWCFARLRDAVSNLESHKAFEQIPTAVQLLLRQRETFLKQECGWMLAALVRQADTTEMPDALESSWQAVLGAVESDSQLTAEIRRWFRR